MEDEYSGTVQAAFSEWDTDSNGTISRAELAAALAEMGMAMNDVQLTRLLQDVTTRGDGEIDYNAFVQWIFKDETPTSKCPTRGKVRESLGIEEDDEEDYDYEESEDDEDEDDYDYDEDDEDDEDEDEEEKDVVSAKAMPSTKRSGKTKKRKPAALQAELDRANEEINRLKANIADNKSSQEAERKARKEQKAAEKAAEKERAAAAADQECLRAAAAAEQSADHPDTAAVVETSPAVAAPAVESPVGATKPRSPKAKRSPKGKRRNAQDFLEEGVVCTQEIQMGEKQQIRSALGVGNDVWTIDWGGMVSIRSRHNAEQIKAQISTSRFVTCMLHMEPSLMWLGQEQQGIKLIDSARKAEVGSLTGGHSSLISCLCVDDPNLGDEGADGAFPVRRAWSGSDDFTIRQWRIQTWRAEATAPTGIPSNAVIVETGGFKTAILKGLQLHGHKNKVRAILRMGPCLWSGSDDGTIRIWNCADSLEKEVISAHREGVLFLSSVRSFVWSAGADGTVREWSNHLPDGSNVRVCLRSIAPEGFNKGVYGVLPLGNEVWACGHNPKIQVFDKQTLEKTCEYDAHNPYVSKLIPVDRMVTKTVWSTSFSDRKLKVWNHVTRDDNRDTDALIAENQLHAKSELNHAAHIEELASKLNEKQAILNALGLDGMDPEDAKKIAENLGKLLDGLKDLSPEEQAKILEKIAGMISGLSHLSAEDMAKALDKVGDLLKNLGHLPAEQMAEALEKLGDLVAALNHLPPEKLVEALDQLSKLVNRLTEKGMLDVLEHLPSVVDAFNDLGLKRLLKNPDILKKFLQAFVNQGMEHLIDDPEKMEAILKIFNDLDAKGLLDGGELNAYMQEGADPELKRVVAWGKQLMDLMCEYKDLLEAMGLGDILKDPSELRKLFEILKALQENGFTDPKGLAEFLANYKAVKAVFDEFGLGELLEDPYTARGWLSNYSKIQQAFKDAGLEYLLSSAGAMKAFLAKYAAAGAELEGMGDLASRLSQLENELQTKDSALQRAKAENEKLKKSLAAYENLGTVDELQRLKDEVITLRAGSRYAGALSSRVAALERELANKEQERLDALARESVMFSRYRELDIFKLDVIARELKGILKKVDLTEKQGKQLKDDANRLKDYSDRKQVEGHGNLMIDGCRQTEAHIHDVILKCFSETQRRHIGIATDNEYRADDRRDGRILEGGTMIYSVEEEMESAAKASLAHVVGSADVQRPDYGSSRAAKEYRSDAIRSKGMH